MHLWLGIASGLVLFVVCLTGTIYTFSSEIQKAVDRNLYTVEVPAAGSERLPAEALIRTLMDSLGSGVVQSVTISYEASASYQISVRPESGGSGRGRGTTYLVNPYTAEILGTTQTSSSEFFMVMFRLHRWLLLDTAIGRPIVGVATLIFTVMILTGMVIWFPKKVRSWRQGLKIRFSAKWKRINHDLHNALGFYAAIFLLIMALTGLTWSFEWYKTGFLDLFGGRPERLQFQSVVTSSPRPSLETFLAAAEKELPYKGEARISLPADSAGVVTVAKTGAAFFATSVPDYVTMDQYSGAVLHVDRFSEKPLNHKITLSIKALHLGSFYGTFSKILYFISCLIGTSLPVTGTLIWINRLRKKKGKGVALKKGEAIAA